MVVYLVNSSFGFTNYEMLVYLFVSSCALCLTGAADLLGALWDDDYSDLTDIVQKSSFPERENQLLVKRLLKLPFTELLKHDAWYKLLNHQDTEYWDVTEWQKYEALIPYLPLSFLQKVNFTDDLILSYFGKLKLNEFQLPQIAEAAIMRTENIFSSEEAIKKLGNIICGFTPQEMSAIEESVWRYLLENDFFQSINACGPEQLRYVKDLLKQHTVIGPPRTWLPKTVKQVGNLIGGLTPSEIIEIREKSFSQITSEAMEFIPPDTLKVVSDSQLKSLNRTALLYWRRKTKDLRWLYRKENGGYNAKTESLLGTTAWVSLLFAYKELSY